MPWLYLASQSPRRRDLLTQWGLEVRPLLPDPTEDVEALEHVQPRETPSRYVQRVTRLKLQAATARLARRDGPPGPVLCADTTVALGLDILGKPDSPAHACAMLERLAGRSHQVYTAVAVAHQGQVWQALSRTQVTFGEWPRDDIERYVATGEPMGKAGAYAIQGLASGWIRRIHGSHTGVMGLPAFETAQLLRSAGLRLL
jgi:septum formation protein